MTQDNSKYTTTLHEKIQEKFFHQIMFHGVVVVVPPSHGNDHVCAMCMYIRGIWYLADKNSLTNLDFL